MTTTLGLTFACLFDLTARFAVATTDRQIAYEEVFHRLTTDSVLGDTDEATDFGFDVRTRLGADMSDDDIAGLGPMLSGVLQRSGRLDSADVVVTRGPGVPGLISLLFAVSVTLVTGDSFSFVFKLTGSTFEQVGTTGSA